MTWGRLLLGGALLVAAGVATYGAATLAGTLSADKPVEPGERTIEARGEAPPPLPLASAPETYGVFLLTNVANGSVWVGQESRLKTSFTCNFAGGGLCAGQTYTTGAPGANVPVQYAKKSADFKTKDEATKSFCAAFQSTPRNIQLAHGVKAQIYGGDYWVDLAPACR
jgi:hypothetical protein